MERHWGQGPRCPPTPGLTAAPGDPDTPWEGGCCDGVGGESHDGDPGMRMLRWGSHNGDPWLTPPRGQGPRHGDLALGTLGWRPRDGHEAVCAAAKPHSLS